MKKYSILNLIAVLVVSFVAWIYCIAIAVLGLIYQAYPGQDNMSILIGTLPTVVTMITAFLGPFLMKKLTRKGAVIISLAISLVCGLTILWMDMSLIGVILCSSLLGIAAGLIPAANASIVTIVAPTSIKDKVIGWHNAIMMLGMSAFTLLAGIFAKNGDFRQGYKVIFILIPVLIITVFLYPNVDKNDLTETTSVRKKNKNAHNGEKMPGYVLIFFILYLVGAVFWNAWFVNYSDYIINEAAIGDASVAGMVGSLSSLAGCIAGFFCILLDQRNKIFKYAVGIYSDRSNNVVTWLNTKCSRMLCWRLLLSVVQFVFGFWLNHIYRISNGWKAVCHFGFVSHNYW